MLGVPFYLMAPIDGVVVRETLPAPLGRRRRRTARVRGARSIDALAGIHAFDWQAGGLDGFGKPDGYLERQVPRWFGQLERYATRPLPDVDAAGRWLQAHTPPMQPPAVIHGDYKLDNVMFAPRLPVELVAVVDWEQSTVGDPLVDLGWMIGLWTRPGERGLARGRVAVRGRGRRADAARSSSRATRSEPAATCRISRSTACSVCSSSRA